MIYDTFVGHIQVTVSGSLAVPALNRFLTMKNGMAKAFDGLVSQHADGFKIRADLFE